MVGPDFAAVELGDEGEQAVGRSVDVGDELGDLGFGGFIVGGEDLVCGEGMGGSLYDVPGEA